MHPIFIYIFALKRSRLEAKERLFNDEDAHKLEQVAKSIARRVGSGRDGCSFYEPHTMRVQRLIDHAANKIEHKRLILDRDDLLMSS